MRVLLVFATRTEADCLDNINWRSGFSGEFRTDTFEGSVLITGVGGISTSWSMNKWLQNNPYPDLAINAGIAGSYNNDIKIGDVVMPVSDCFADMGIENGSSFITLAEAGLIDPDGYPFKNGIITAENEFVKRSARFLKSARAITVNTSSGNEQTIMKLKLKYNPDVETMEGATFFYICAMEKIPFLAIRSVSNRVEPRNKNNWDIPLAIANLSGKLNETLLIVK